jgi:adenylate kinase family enzyme
MVVLRADDALSVTPQRVLVSGPSGSGKSTLARAIAETLDLQYLEIDSLFHGPQWTPRESFLDEVTEFADGPRWVTEWQYPAARPVLLDRADTMVLLDHRRSTVLWRLARRTARRRLRRTELWNENVEGPLWKVFTDPDHILRWSWRTHRNHPRRFADVAADRERRSMNLVRLAGQRDVDTWCAGPLRWTAETTGPNERESG